MDETIQYKLFRLALPVPLLAAGFAILYSAANWFLVANSGLIPIDEDLVTYWLPFVLACIVVALLVAPHIRVLDIEGKRRDPRFLYDIAAVGVIAVPAILAQVYVKDASGTLTHVKDASLIASAPASKYYIADTICVDRTRAKAHPAFWTGGSQNQSLWFAVYVVAPLCQETGHTSSIWIGETFKTSIDNRLSDAEREARYKAFAAKAEVDYNAEDAANIRYFERAGVSFARRNFEKALRESGASSTSTLILVPHTEPFEARVGNTLVWVFRSLGIGAALWFVLVMLTPADYGKVAQKLTDEEVEDAELQKEVNRTLALTLFVPHPKSYGLPILIDVNLAVFLVMVASGLGVDSFQVDDLIAWGAQYGPLMHGAGFFRLISSQFLHEGLMHIAQNMYGLIFAGFFLSPVMRNAGLIAAYLICGLVGNVASYVIDPNMVSAGASGAIMGLWGILITLALLNDPRVTGARTVILINIGIFTVLTLATGFVRAGIDNSAHIGGLAAGVVIGGLVTMFRPKGMEDMPTEPTG